LRSLGRALYRGLTNSFTAVRLILAFTLLNLIFAAVAILPLAHALDRLVSPAGPGSAAWTAWPFWLDTDFRTGSGPAMDLFPTQAGIVVLLYTLVSSFWTAGALGVLHDGDGAFSTGAFLRGSARYGFRFVRLLGLFLAACWLLSWLVGEQLGELRRGLQFDWPSQRGVFFLTLGHELLFLLLFYGLTLLFDYARLHVVVEKRRSALGSMLAAGVFLARHPAGALGIFGLLALAQAVFLMLSGEVVARFPAGSFPGLLGLFLLAQIVVAARFAFRLAYLECGRLWLLERLGPD
jgi:hypothetical protein